MRSITSKLVQGCSSRWLSRYIMPLPIQQSQSFEGFPLSLVSRLFSFGCSGCLYLELFISCSGITAWAIFSVFISSLTTISWMLFLIWLHFSYALSLSGLWTMPKCQIWTRGVFRYRWHWERDAGWPSKLLYFPICLLFALDINVISQWHSGPLLHVIRNCLASSC